MQKCGLKFGLSIASERVGIKNEFLVQFKKYEFRWTKNSNKEKRLSELLFCREFYSKLLQKKTVKNLVFIREN